MGAALTAEEKAIAVWLKRRPDWLPEGKPWISREECEALARLNLQQADVDEAYREAKDGRKTLENPAGLVIKKLRRCGTTE